MPSTDTMVLLGSSSVALVMAWTTASVPARVDRAYWCGEQAWWMCWENCCARLRATNLRRRSPITRPRTRPLGFWRATRRPRPSAWLAVSGSSALAICCVTWMSLLVASSSSRTSRKVSAVRPEGPGAAPFLARHKLVVKICVESVTGSCGW